jgi:MoaE-MoaD fusion protein
VRPHSTVGQALWVRATLVARQACRTVCYRDVVMKVDVLFFGILKDMVERSGETVDLPEGARVRELLFYYAQATPRFEAMISSLAISVNHEYAPEDWVLRDGDEVGLLPPVSGGMTDGRSEIRDEAAHETVGEVRIVRERIDSEAVIGRLKRSSDGAVVAFDGIVRDNTRNRRTLYLDYEAYEPMAMKQMESLAAESRTRFPVRAASIIHRLGRLEIGETSVFIVVSAAHRGAAFEACRWIIDTLKKTVPIWKKEYFEDGAVWADGEPFPQEIRSQGGKLGGSPHPSD